MRNIRKHLFTAVLQRKVDSVGIRLRIVNAGFSGETSAGALRRLEWLLRDSANIVMIETVRLRR